ncbi:ABC transporter permease [Roseivivax sediminis]|uniref:Glycine betaine/proline transport system permease protein n=1 Tax=Roseivivax sediminis TaxID=936889 RepID=A0A1I1VLS7_9RHOB|nr:ABC transporter permease subunit [Roseivivax sediminis]SFD83861.1 glycine betaine/proline transport system permease protein [Roseivivax sediminis]
MSLTLSDTSAGGALQRASLLVWGATLAAIVLLWIAAGRLGWIADPADVFVIPIEGWLSAFVDWLSDDLSFGLFTFRDLTRALAWVLEIPLSFFITILSRGTEVPLGAERTLTLPPVPWFAILFAFVWLCWVWGGRRLAILAIAALGYLVVFGQWGSAMVTLSSILVAVPVGVAGGMALGILAYRSDRVARGLTPVLDLMQTVPIFAYLVPVLVLFGFGPVSAMIATVIYAMPPMVRVTMLALRGVSPELLELGRMTGCTRRQMLWRILLPSARPSLMVGVNQVIMLSLNMVIIASMIGAGGLGYDVLTSLRRLEIGNGLQAGLAITLLAILLDRMSHAYFAYRETPRAQRRAQGVNNAAMIGALLAGAYVVGLIFPALTIYPDAWVIDTSPFWDGLVTWINLNLYDYLDAVKTFLLIYVLVPVKRFMLDVPWLAVALLLAVVGWRLSGLRLAVTVAGMAAFIAFTGNWEKAMVSVYLCGISVLIASTIGILWGLLAARSDRAYGIAVTSVDTLQTLPSFVYLIPVVMLFQVGDFSAMIAIVLYALAPAVRYTAHGLRRLPSEIVEASRMSGCTPRQMLWRVRLPLALPEIALGINQTIMMALSMLVITALVGTSDLGQEVYIALTRSNVGQGLVAGLCVAFIGMISDRLITAWVARRKAQFRIE